MPQNTDKAAFKGFVRVRSYNTSLSCFKCRKCRLGLAPALLPQGARNKELGQAPADLGVSGNSGVGELDAR